MRKPQLGRQQGQGLVEFAVIFPIFAFLLFAVIDGGLLMGRYNNINNAAKEGARLAAVGAQKSEIVTRVQRQAHGELDNTGSHPLSTSCGDYANPPAKTNVICVEWINGPSASPEPPGTVGSSVRVKVKYQYQFLTPIINWFGPGGWTVTACAVQRVEQSIKPVPVTGSGTSC